MANFVIICPTYNAGLLWDKWISMVKEQIGLKCQVINIDSESNDDTYAKSKDAGFYTIRIPKVDFNHAGTRNKAVQIARKKFKAEILIFLTQDALLDSPKSISYILNPFDNPNIAAVCGRQVPHDNADPIASHARFYNYSNKSFVNDKADIPQKGLKAAYMSNSFAAYRYTVYEKCGGFPEGLIFGEDMFLAAKILLKGYKTYYSADAVVKHSHNYSLKEEFKRYFDIGVFHSSQPFLIDNFGRVSGEGMKFAISELRYCLKLGGAYWGVNSIFRSGLKFIGYKLGSLHKRFPTWFNRKLSMDKHFWQR
ncbi:MAG: glycosyltransferase family 2 protein [Bacteroidota bacterium]